MRRIVLASGLTVGLLALTTSALAGGNLSDRSWVADATLADGHTVSSDGNGDYTYDEGGKGAIVDDDAAYDFMTFYNKPGRTFNVNLPSAGVSGDCAAWSGFYVKSGSTPQWFEAGYAHGRGQVGCKIGDVTYRMDFGGETYQDECVTISRTGDTWRFSASCVGNVTVSRSVGKKGNTSYQTIATGQSGTFDLTAHVRCTQTEWKRRSANC